jgi:hypothetical protein
MIPPVGEGRSNRDVFARLAAAMGFEEAFFQQSANQLIDVLLSASAPRGLSDGERVTMTFFSDSGYALGSSCIEIMDARLMHSGMTNRNCESINP